MSQVLAPGGFAGFIGVKDDADRRMTVRLVGRRELTCGFGILTRPRPAGWLWARVAGELMDLALLGTALTGAPRRDKVTAATLGVVGVTAADLLASVEESRRTDGSILPWASGQFNVKQAVTVGRPAEELYRYWHDFENLSRFMTHLESVQVTGDRRSHWRAKAPAGSSIEWDAEIVEDRPNELITWRSVPGSRVDNSGWVRL